MTHDHIPARLVALKAASTPDLKAQWRDLFGSEPPPGNRRFLEGRLAFRLQELAYGGLKPETLRRLEKLGGQLDGAKGRRRRGGSERRLMAGTRLVREYQGVEHVFAYQKGPMGLLVRTIGLARARAAITLANMGYNMRRWCWLDRRTAPA